MSFSRNSQGQFGRVFETILVVALEEILDVFECCVGECLRENSSTKLPKDNQLGYSKQLYIETLTSRV